MSTATEIDEIFTGHLAAAEKLTADASAAVQTAFATFSNVAAYQYTPYEYQTASPPLIFYNPTYNEPGQPIMGIVPTMPPLDPYPKVGDIKAGTLPINTAKPPTYNYPSPPSGPPSDGTGNVPARHEPDFPDLPVLYALPAATLPYETLNLPDAPEWTDPIFDAKPPEDITSITLEEYLQKLKEAFNEYADLIPRMVQGHWLDWYRAMLGQNPLIARIEQILTSYYNTGGAGIPVPVEEAIVTRATDRVTTEYKRAHAAVFESATRRGFLLPSGTLIAGLKNARQMSAEGVSKVATDVAIKNLELEQDYMKFMLQLGVNFEKMLLDFAGSLANTVTQLNGQAIEMVKQVLTGMIAINDAIIKIYLARWEGYKAAIEVYKAQWQAIEMQIRVYEAEIKAELAKTEIDKAYVEVLTAMVGANTALVNMYKSQVDAETAKLEADRVAIMGYQAAVQAYVAKVEGYKAAWQGYAAATEGQTAKAKAYEAEVQAYSASVQGYRAGIEAQGEVVKATAVHIDAVAKQNEGILKSWQIQLDGVIRAYTGQLEGYKTQWQAVSEKLKGYAEGTRIMADSLFRGYTAETNMDIERAHQHLGEWSATLAAQVAAGKGVTEVANVAAQTAASALNGLTAFAGKLSESTAA